MNNNLALRLVEGTKEDRDQYINKVDVLEKVKGIISLPVGDYVDVKMAAEYFEVSYNTLSQTIKRNREELESDGLRTLKGEEIQNFKESLKVHNVLLKAKGHITVLTRQSLLRLGMLLRDSEIARQIRNYLIVIEMNSTPTQKETALRFSGEWNKEIDNYIFSKVEEGIQNNKSIKHTLSLVAKEIDAPEVKVRTRWYAGNKEFRPLRDRLNKETRELVTKGEHLKPVSKVNEEKIITEVSSNFNKQNELIHMLISELKETQTNFEKLHSDMGKLWRGYKEIHESHELLTAEIDTVKKYLIKQSKTIETDYVLKVAGLENKIESITKKLKLERKELEKAKMFIADNLIDQNSDAPKVKSYKMDRNGNLTFI